jgi:asparagine synthase (glutamine-hydrolysing)
MCGIAGIIGAVDEHALRRMTALLRHRGPDGDGIWIAPDGMAGLGHRRLKIIDLSDDGRQPMVSEDGRYVLTYNGEIFNYRELRRELESTGCRFRSKADSEVLLNAFAKWGKDVLKRVVGQFAFAVWDTAEHSLFAARDHLGIKPFYYHHRGDSLYFASEPKAILDAVPRTRQADLRGLPQYLSFLWIPGSATMFDGIRKLEPGMFLTFAGSSLHIESYWDPLQNARLAPSNPMDRIELFRGIFNDAVQSQLVSDVPLGLLLSGGLDSTAILASMSEAGRSAQAFTATYSRDSRAGDLFDDDLPHARTAAARFHADLRESLLEHNVIEALPRVTWHLDEPLADPTTITNEALTRAARPSLTVLLTGMGADEILAGYPRFPAALLGEKLRCVPSPLFSAAHGMLSMMLRMGVMPIARARRWMMLSEQLHKPFFERYIGFSSYFSETGMREILSGDLVRLIDRESIAGYHRAQFDRAEGHSPLGRMLYADLKTFLPNLNLENMDKTSMANSVEMRVPFLDHRLVEFAFTLPDSDKLDGFRTKVLLRKAFEGRIPAEILSRKKTGYSPPIRGWMRGPLRDLTRDTLLSNRCMQRGVLNSAAAVTLMNENDRGLRDNSMKLWQLLVLETWFRVCIENDNQSRGE